jgi:intracellular septation protein A
MPGEFPPNDPRNIWQNQPMEPFTMSLEQIRHKAQEYQKRARFKALAAMIVGVYLSLCFGWIFSRVHEVVPCIGWAILSLWGLYVAYQAYRWIWPRRLMPAAALSASVEFYRSELEKQLNFNRHTWGRSGLAFCLLGLALALIPPLIQSIESPRLLLNFAPFLILLVIFFISLPYIRRQDKEKLQEEIEQLRALEKDK